MCIRDREFDMTSKELLDRLAEMKIPAKSHASILQDAYVQKVRKNLEQIEQQKIERKEKTENELLVRRSSRAGREDDTQRR